MTTDISAIYSDTGYWHGTGRYKYTENNTVTDILKGMIEEGGLAPHDDDWDWELGKIKSISLARSRMYARLYAAMFMPHGKRITNEYGPRWLWFHYFFDTARLLALIIYISPYGLLKEYPRKLAIWAAKITTEKRSKIFSIFENGTDIAENYPILIGIKTGSITPLMDAMLFNLHETRTENIVTFDDMTHIEVPRERVSETEALLQKSRITITVLPIEEGEAYSRRFSFINLVSGKPLKPMASFSSRKR